MIWSVLGRFIVDLNCFARGLNHFGRFTRMSENPQCNVGLRRSSVNTSINGFPFFSQFSENHPLSTCCRRVELERSPINTSIKWFRFFAKFVCDLLLSTCCLRVRLQRIFVNTSINFVLFCNVFHCLPFSTCCLRVRCISFTIPRSIVVMFF